MTDSIYSSGEYFAQHPAWHEHDSPWKTDQILRMLRARDASPTSICDVGCGSGEIMNLLSKAYPSAECVGYDVSPQAIGMARSKETERLKFHVGDAFADGREFDLALAIDVFEHVDDYLGFIRKMRDLAKASIFHIPLDLTSQSVARGRPLMHVRQSVGHLHYFTKDTALASLDYAGLDVVSWFYTAGHARSGRKLKTRLAMLPRLACYRLSPDLAVRLLGGYSLLAFCTRKP